MADETRGGPGRNEPPAGCDEKLGHVAGCIDCSRFDGKRTTATESKDPARKEMREIGKYKDRIDINMK